MKKRLPEDYNTYYGKEGAKILHIVENSLPTFFTSGKIKIKPTKKYLEDYIYEKNAAVMTNLEHYFWLKKWGKAKIKLNGSERTSMPYNSELFAPKKQKKNLNPSKKKK